MFDAAPVLTGASTGLRPLKEDDFASLSEAASDPGIWAGHPARTRYQTEEFRGYFDMLIAAGGTMLVTERSSGAVIGCSRYYVAPDRPDDISIGFTFLIRRVWGGTVNFEVKHLMLEHAFGTYDAVWFHIAPDNLRSQKATSKLGAKLIESKVLDLGGGEARRFCYRLDRAEWTLRVAQAQNSSF